MSGFIRTAGIYKGIVVDTEDPAGLNRIQVRILEIHGLMEKSTYGPLRKKTAVDVLRYDDEELPWAEVCYPFGDTTPPELNQVVWVMFYGGNEQYPVIVGWSGYDYTQKEEAFEQKR